MGQPGGIVLLASLLAASMGWRPASGASIGMPAGSTVWMEFETSAFSDELGSNQAGPNPPNGIPLSSFTNGIVGATGYAEILPDRVRTLARSDFGGGGFASAFLHASFQDTYLVGGTAAGPFNINVELHVTGVARSAGIGSTSLSHQMVGVNGEAEIGVFQTFTDPDLGEGLRISPFAGSSAGFSFATEASASPFEHPIDVTASHTVLNVNVGDTIVLAYGVNSRFARGEIDLLNTGAISFDLPDGVFLTSALAESLVPEPDGFALLLAAALCLAAIWPLRGRLLPKRG